jgi:hypothetical protein
MLYLLLKKEIGRKIYIEHEVNFFFDASNFFLRRIKLLTDGVVGNQKRDGVDGIRRNKK